MINSVPAHRKALPMPIMSGQAPVYSPGPQLSGPRKVNYILASSAHGQMTYGGSVPQPATLTQNVGRQGAAPVRASGPIAGVGDVRKLSVKTKQGNPSGPQPGTTEGNPANVESRIKLVNRISNR